MTQTYFKFKKNHVSEHAKVITHVTKTVKIITTCDRKS